MEYQISSGTQSFHRSIVRHGGIFSSVLPQERLILRKMLPYAMSSRFFTTAVFICPFGFWRIKKSCRSQGWVGILKALCISNICLRRIPCCKAYFDPQAPMRYVNISSCTYASNALYSDMYKSGQILSPRLHIAWSSNANVEETIGQSEFHQNSHGNGPLTIHKFQV